MTHIPVGTEREGARYHHAIQNSMQFKYYKLFTSEICHIVPLDPSRPWVTETAESETTGKEGLLHYTVWC